MQRLPHLADRLNDSVLDPVLVVDQLPGHHPPHRSVGLPGRVQITPRR